MKFYFHLGPWTYENGHYAGEIPGFIESYETLFIEELPTICECPSQDELG